MMQHGGSVGLFTRTRLEQLVQEPHGRRLQVAAAGPGLPAGPQLGQRERPEELLRGGEA